MSVRQLFVLLLVLVITSLAGVLVTRSRPGVDLSRNVDTPTVTLPGP